MRSMGSHQSARGKSHVWLTPPSILERLGPFELDPCAAPAPRPWPTAAVHWTEQDDPLDRDWHGRVWLNPPFGPRCLLNAFLHRMAEHNHGVALLAARTETDTFFRFVWPSASAMLFLRTRPHFHHPSGERAASNSGAPIVLVAYGPDAARLEVSGLDGRFVRLSDA